MAQKKGSSRFKPQRRHGFTLLIFICGMLLPPIAVLVRFGVGSDFFLNIFLTICGYFPGHGHNFWLQNIRNNKNKNRTPKWALKYGLVEDYAAKRKVKREWANRYDERLPNNDYDTAPAEDEWGNPVARPEASEPAKANGRPRRSSLDPHDDAHYGDDRMPSGARDLEHHDSYDSRSRRGGGGGGGGGDRDFSELPGAGDRVVRHQTGGALSKFGVGGGRKKAAASSGGDDRFARMDAERDRAGYGSGAAANSDFDESWISGGTARPAPASSSAARRQPADPLNAAQEPQQRQWKPTDDLPDHNF